VSDAKVTWAQVGGVTEPGRYMFRFGYVTVTAGDLALWAQFPNARFTLFSILSDGPSEEYKLGSFDILPPHD
jgi:hypothetical protein